MNQNRLAKVQWYSRSSPELPEDITPAVMNQAVYGKQIWPTLVRRWWTLFVRKPEIEPIQSRIPRACGRYERNASSCLLALHLLFEVVMVEAHRLNRTSEEVCEKPFNDLLQWASKMDGRCRYCGWEIPRNAFCKDEPQGRSGFPDAACQHGA